MRYKVMSNTGSSMWEVTHLETTPEVDAYIRQYFPLTMQSGNPGVFQAVRVAERLLEMIQAGPAGDGQEDIHADAVRQLATLNVLLTTHHGAAIEFTNPNQQLPYPD
jgi:hypothetical protein